MLDDRDMFVTDVNNSFCQSDRFVNKIFVDGGVVVDDMKGNEILF